MADYAQITKTIKALKRTVWATGFIGLIVMVVGSKYFSITSFASSEYAIPIAFLGFSVFLTNIATGQNCLLQGFRRIPDLAKVSIIGSICGLVLSLPCYYIWGKNGVVLSLVYALPRCLEFMVDGP